MHQAELVKKLEHTIHNVNEKELELLIYLIGNMEETEKYNINTTKERLEQIKAEEEQEEAERKNKVNAYRTNETMRMLEHQCPFEIIGKQGFKEIDNILKANPYTATQETAINLFILGYIYGKRAERARRKGRCNGKYKKEIIEMIKKWLTRNI